VVAWSKGQLARAQAFLRLAEGFDESRRVSECIDEIDANAALEAVRAQFDLEANCAN
jgi:hypothetical protein